MRDIPTGSMWSEWEEIKTKERKEMEEHKKCPCCGGYGIVSLYREGISHGREHYIKCAECGLRTVPYSTMRRAWQAWDRRVEEPKTFNPKFPMEEQGDVFVWFAEAEGIRKGPITQVIQAKCCNPFTMEFSLGYSYNIDTTKEVLNEDRLFTNPEEALTAWHKRFGGFGSMVKDSDFNEVEDESED